MNLTDDYSQGAVIACQTLIGYDWMRGEIDLTPPRILCARTEQQPHLQSRHRKGSGLHGDCLHEQGRLGVLRGKANVITVRFDLRVLVALNRSGSLQLLHQKSFWPGSSLWVMSVDIFEEDPNGPEASCLKRESQVVTAWILNGSGQMAKLWRTWIKARDLGCSCNSWQEMSSQLVLDTSQC